MIKFVKGKLYSVIVGVILFLFCACIVFALLWGLVNSFKERSDFFDNKIGLPKPFYFENYTKAFEKFIVVRMIKGNNIRYNLLSMFFNTVLYAAGSAAINIVTCCIVAYLCAKYQFRFSRFIHSLVVAVLIIPIVGAMPSQIQLLRLLKIQNSIWALWLPNLNFTGVNFLIFYSTFKSLPDGFRESAFVDGASHTAVMFQIMVPLVRSTIAVLFLVSFVRLWNDYQTPLVYWESHPTIAVGLFDYTRNPLNSSVPEQIAGCMITVFPVLLLFLIFKDKMMGNLTLGGLKG
jgi:ABC-type glycerol-3-phosphate transport system permease component